MHVIGSCSLNHPVKILSYLVTVLAVGPLPKKAGTGIGRFPLAETDFEPCRLSWQGFLITDW